MGTLIYSTLNTRILIVKDPRNEVITPHSFWESPVLGLEARYIVP